MHPHRPELVDPLLEGRPSPIGVPYGPSQSTPELRRRYNTSEPQGEHRMDAAGDLSRDSVSLVNHAIHPGVNDQIMYVHDPIHGGHAGPFTVDRERVIDDSLHVVNDQFDSNQRTLQPYACPLNSRDEHFDQLHGSGAMGEPGGESMAGSLAIPGIVGPGMDEMNLSLRQVWPMDDYEMHFHLNSQVDDGLFDQLGPQSDPGYTMTSAQSQQSGWPPPQADLNQLAFVSQQSLHLHESQYLPDRQTRPGSAPHAGPQRRSAPAAPRPHTARRHPPHVTAQHQIVSMPSSLWMADRVHPMNPSFADGLQQSGHPTWLE